MNKGGTRHGHLSLEGRAVTISLPGAEFRVQRRHIAIGSLRS